MPKVKKMAMLHVKAETLRVLLQLPAEAEVVHVDTAPGYRGMLKIVIEGAGWDTPEGCAITLAEPAVVASQRNATGEVVSRVVDWKLPKGK